MTLVKNKNVLNYDEKSSHFVDPAKIIDLIEIKKGDNVADFGCGPGYFSLAIAKIIGEKGEVYAFDVLPSAIEALESQSRMQGVDNIIVKRVNLEKEQSSMLDDESVDWVIIKNVLFQNENKKNILKEAYRILKKGGKVLIIEWNNNLAMGPTAELRVDSEKLMKIIDEENFIFEKQIAAGDYHYAIIADKL